MDRHRVEVPALRLDGAEAIEALFNLAYDSELANRGELFERPGAAAGGADVHAATG